MPQMILNEFISQLIAAAVGGIVAALIAAIGVGGFLWRKMRINDTQNQRMDDIMASIDDLGKIVHTMSCHQLQVSCERALEKGCISLHEMQEIQRLYEQYRGMSWNGPGEVAYEKLKADVEIREDCDG